MTKKEQIETKICLNQNDENILRNITIWKFKNKKITFIYGNFDILHFGNIDFLTKASEFGDILVTGIRTNPKVEVIHSQNQRALNIASFNFVNLVVPYETNAIDVIKNIKPDYIVCKSNQNNIKEVQEYATKNNIKVEIIDCLENLSSIEFVQKIKAN